MTESPPGGPPSPKVPRYGTLSQCSVVGQKRPHTGSALELGPRKRPAAADPLVHHGRHFGRTVYAFANMHALLLSGLSLDDDEPPTTQQERREARVFDKLLKMIPHLEGRLFRDSCDENEVLEIATLLQKGTSSARSDDTKSLKGAVLDWIVPTLDEPLRPPLARNTKIDRGFNHPRTGFLLCPAGLDWDDEQTQKNLKNKVLSVPGNHWPIFLYRGEVYDPEEPWRGFCRSKLLVCGYKHIFTSPSSVDNDPRATRSGNARLHGMTHVTPASIAYVATQIRFGLSSASIFCRTDKETDSETFYTSLLELFEDPEEQDEVRDLIAWWNRQIFPSFSNVARLIPTNSVLSKMKAKRAALKGIDSNKQAATSTAASGEPGEQNDK